jgi:hypothetical protein
MPNRPPHNGEKPLSMRIDPGYDRDPLRPKMHRVVVEVAPGKWEIIGNTGDPIELLRIQVGANHAIGEGFRGRNCMIVDEEDRVAEKFETYTPQPQAEGDPINEANIKLRSRWILAIVKWLIPSGWTEKPDTDETQKEIRDFLKEIKVEIAFSPDGKTVIIWRDGSQLADWSCL